MRGISSSITPTSTSMTTAKVGIPPEYKFQIENTAWTDLLIQTHAKAEWEAKNVFFLEDGGTSYLLKLFTAAKVE